jgi:arginine deiminase
MKTTDGPIPMGITFDMVDRKVVGKETITTSAGTFDCYKITYNTKSKIVMANMNMKNVQYIAEEVGAVKTEVYKDNGKLVSYSLLTKYQP